MFDKLFTNFKTEKELILHIIENYSNISFSQLYDRVARKEWKEKYHDDSAKYQVYRWDNWLMRDLAIFSDDEDIIRALHAIRYAKILRSDSNRKLSIFVNVNLPDDLIDCYINSPIFLREDLSKESDRLYDMLKVGFNSTVNEKIQSRIDEIVTIKRKNKEDKTKDKLKAFLITASATKSVLTGNAIDDVVEASINDTVNDEVLDYMNKLFGDKK